MTFFEEIKKDWKKGVIGLIVVASFSFGGDILNLFNSGVDVEFNKKIDARIKSKMDDSALIKIILESQQVSEFTDEVGEELRNSIIDDVMSEDTNKINFNAYLGKELGVRDELVLPMLLELMKAYEKGDFVTQKELDTRTGTNPNANEF